MSNIKVTFLGGAQTVTGSKYYIESPELNIMVDCGIFQGLKELRKLNWNILPIDVKNIHFVLLTHGHLDHVGYLPRLVKNGFSGKIIGTEPTLEIAEIILKDSAKINEEEAEKAKREGYSKHKNPQPFYTEYDVLKTITFFTHIALDQEVKLSQNISCVFKLAGHIIGATFIELNILGRKLLFSGDLGRFNDYLLPEPSKPNDCDYLFIESTYGNKLHPKEDIAQIFKRLINDTVAKKGNLIIPSFAVERLQTLMYVLFKLYLQQEIPNIPVFVDSPMGTNVLKVFKHHIQWHKLSPQEYEQMYRFVSIVQSYRDTWKTIDDKRSKIVIAGSGMVTGGRVLTYLKQLVDKSETNILLVGYQAEGTRGRQLKEGAHEIKIFGKFYSVKASVSSIESFSAHADQHDLIRWVGTFKKVPKHIYLIHGEPTAMDAFRVKLKDTYNVVAHIPKLGEQVVIN